ncbi:MAG: elongation factor Ts [Firmicutes bacterium]|nr:elongation factor Ts [Bacillota bacterium]
MTAITAKMVSELRELTGAGMMDCKKALVACDGDTEKAIDFLREKGLAAAAKKAGRIAAEGLVGVATTEDASSAVIIEVNSETDFVAANPEFQALVAASAQAALNNDVADVEALLATDCGEGTVSELLTAKIAKIGENMTVRRFAKFADAGCVCAHYIHGNGKVGVVVELETEATIDEVKECGRSLAMQVASMNPKFVDESAVDAEWKEKELHILLQQALNENAELEKPKPEAIVEKMVNGRLAKQLKEVCLLQQVYVKDGEMTVAQYVAKTAKEIGKEIKVKAFVRYEVGEGIEKKQSNLAEEVAALTGGAK